MSNDDDSYKEIEEVSHSHEFENEKKEIDDSGFYKICENMQNSFSNPIEFSTLLAEFANFLRKAPVDQYDGVFSFNIPKLLADSFFQENSQIYLIRPVTICISLLYEKCLSTRAFYESDDFINMLIDINSYVNLIDYKILILYKILELTSNPDLSLYVFERFSLDSIYFVLKSSSNDQVIFATFNIIKILSKHISDADDSKIVLEMINKNIRRGAKKSIIPMLLIIDTFINQNILDKETFLELKFDKTLSETAHILDNKINIRTAQVLIDYAEKYNEAFDLDLNLFMDNITNDPNNKNINDDSRKVFAKLMMECVLYGNSSLIPEMFEKDVLRYFYCEIDTFTVSVKSYIVVIISRALYQANIENILQLIDQINEFNVSLFKPIEIGIEINVDFVVESVLFALTNLISLIGKNEDFNSYFQDHFFEEIDKTDIESFSESENETISQLAVSILNSINSSFK